MKITRKAALIKSEIDAGKYDDLTLSEVMDRLEETAKRIWESLETEGSTNAE